MKFETHLSALPGIFAYIREKMPIADQVRKKIELAVEEIVVNIITHSVSPFIEIECETDGVLAEVIIRDQGVEFDPLKHHVDRQEKLPIEERHEGGLGIFFVTELMDEVKYRREGGSNVLILRKRILSREDYAEDVS